MKKEKINSTNEKNINIFYYYFILMRVKFAKLIKRNKLFKKRRPHRSFRLTRRRDYKRSLKLPKYIPFTKQVLKIIKANRNIFLCLVLLSSLLGIILIGLMDQSFLNSLGEVLNETSGDLLKGGFGEVGKAGIMLMSTFSSGGLVQSLSESQTLILVIIVLFVWLTTVVILRDYLAGKKITLREALYICGSPIVSIFVVVIFMILQLVPIFIAIIIYSSAVSTQFLAGIGGVETMLFAAVVLLLTSLSIYWIVGSFFALIISTLPGMNPMRAVKFAGDMVIGRRLRILFRMIWCLFLVALAWIIIMIPTILLFGWLGSLNEFINEIPFVQIVMLLVSNASLVFICCYTYVFYREVVKDDAQPA